MERFITAPVSFSGQTQTDGPLLDTQDETAPGLSAAFKTGLAGH